MSIQFTRDQVLELLPAYVLGKLEPEEMLAVDNYLEEQRELLAQLNQAEQAAAQLVHTAPVVPLPGDARERLMARVRADLPAQVAEEGNRATTTPEQSGGNLPARRFLKAGPADCAGFLDRLTVGPWLLGLSWFCG